MMAVGDCKIAYGASTAFTVTNLQGLASDTNHLGCWESNAVDNTSNLYTDYLIAGKIQVESSGLAAGEIRVYIVAVMEDSTWPDVFDGTESTETMTDTEIRDGYAKLGAVLVTDTGASDVYYFGPFSVASLFGGVCPSKFVVVITQSTGQPTETTGSPNAVYYKGIYYTVAAN
jgi:hypothetical protein